jgi:uncharacterized protein with HEPN domain
MRLEVKKYLFDIQQAAKLVLLFTAGLSFQEYAKIPWPDRRSNASS